jgi:hypothetical protein
MNTRITLLVGVCMIVGGCIDQTQEGQAGEPYAQETVVASPQEHPGPQGPNSRLELPPAMADACVGKSVNDTCELMTGETVINGACMTIQNGSMACFPARSDRRPMPPNESMQGPYPGPAPPGGPRGINLPRGIPREMIDACGGKSENDACALKTNEGVLNGTCGIRHSGELACFPTGRGRMPMPPNGSMEGQFQGQRPPL